MLRRQSLRLRPRLNALDRPSPLSFIALHDPQIDRRPAAVGRRWLASASAEAVSTPIYSFEEARREQGYLYPRDRPASEWPSTLESLLDAIRRHDENAILVRFFRWEQSLRHGDSEIREVARQELQELPSSTFSEILRFIDPVKNPHIDIAYGLNLTVGQAQTTNASVLLNRYGVRKRADKLLKAVNAVCEARLAGGVSLLAPDYEVLLRCAGAASNISASLRTFTMMSRAGLAAKQNTSSWVEFLKARFLIDPQYYQWDRTRVAVNARQLHSNKEPAEPKALWKLERMRFSRNALLVWPYSRQPGKERQELRMRLRKKRGHTSTHEHWFLAKVGGVLVNEELLCASMISFARSGSLVLIKGIVLKRGFRIKMKEDPETGEVTVWGGKRFREGSPRKPTAKFLNAIVESFGCMSRIQTGLKLLIYVSEKYEIPIPQTTWSNLLQWTYVCTSKPYSNMAKYHQDYPVKRLDYTHVLAIWTIMTSTPYTVQPTIDDYSCYIKALIRGQRLKEAIAIIRNDVVPYYRQLEEGHFESITNDILKSRVRASKDRLEMETLKEYTWFHIHSWLRKIIRTASSNSRLRNEIFMEVHVPNLIHEFSDFFHKAISYRTAQGYVTLHRPNVVKRFDYVPEYRRTLPQAYGGNMMRSFGKGEDDPTERPAWRDVRKMRILQWSRKPRKRVRVTGRPPQAGDVDARKWWKTLEKELMT